jgi:hypothetical protein
LGGVRVKSDKSIVGGSLCVLIIFLTQFFLKATEATDFSVQITIIVILVGGILFAIGMLKSKDKVFGFKLNLISVILMMIVCMVSIIGFILIECFPQVFKTHHLLSIMIGLLTVGSLLAFVIFLVVASTITAKKNQR